MKKPTETFQTSQGVTLELVPIKRHLIEAILTDLGDVVTIARNPEMLLKMKPTEQAQALEVVKKLFTLCAGWGISNDPPDDPETNEILDVLGAGSDQPRTRRADWLRLCVLTNDNERGAFIGHCLAFAYQETTQQETKEQRIARLQKELEELT